MKTIPPALSLIRTLGILLLGAFVFIACFDDDDDSGSDSTDVAAGAEQAADSTPDPSARPGLARIIVDCDMAEGPITVFINGDDLGEKILPKEGGEIFSNTVLGEVTYSATAAGVSFAPVTLDMVLSENDAFQLVDLVCGPPATP